MLDLVVYLNDSLLLFHAICIYVERMRRVYWQLLEG